MHNRRFRLLGVGGCLGACVLLAGCRSTLPHVTQAAPPAEPAPKLSAAQKANVQVALAQSLEKSASPQDAIAAYEQVLKKDPRRADACNRIAMLYGKQGQWEQALAYHAKALASQPGNADYHCNLGYTYYLQRRWAEAEKSFRKAIELAPDHARAHINLGLVEGHSGQEQLALASFRRGGCTEAESLSNLAFVQSLENALPAAQAHYQKSLALDPANTAAQNGQKMIAEVARKQAPAAPFAKTQPPVTTPLSEAPTMPAAASPAATQPSLTTVVAAPAPSVSAKSAALVKAPAALTYQRVWPAPVATQQSPDTAAVNSRPGRDAWTTGFVTFDFVEPSAEEAEATGPMRKQSPR